MSQLFRAFGKDNRDNRGHTQLKHSVQRSIKSERPLWLPRRCRRRRPPLPALTPPRPALRPAAQIGEQYPWLVESGVLEVLLPKKAELTLIKL